MKCQKSKSFDQFGNLRFQKKAQGLSLSTIVIAAIVLIVLVILIVIFTGRMSGFVDNIEDCETKGGTSNPTGKLDNHACYKIKTESTNKYCCIPIKTT